VHRVLSDWKFIGCSYVVIIVGYAFAYSYFELFKEPLSFWRGLYLSVVTITTLGYGDITSDNNFGMFLTASESVVGIMVFGVFINSLWKNYSDKMELNQEEIFNKSLKLSNKKKLLSYYRCFQVVINEYKDLNFELTTPISERRIVEFTFNFDFKFSGLKDLFKRSIRNKYGFEKSVIELYFSLESSIIGEMKYILSNYRFEGVEEIESQIIEFIEFSYVTSTEEYLTGIAKSFDESTRNTLEEMIQGFESAPPEEYLVSNILLPVDTLYKTIPIKMYLIKKIEKEFEKIQSELASTK